MATELFSSCGFPSRNQQLYAKFQIFWVPKIYKVQTKSLSFVVLKHTCDCPCNKCTQNKTTKQAWGDTTNRTHTLRTVRDHRPSPPLQVCICLWDILSVRPDLCLGPQGNLSSSRRGSLASCPLSNDRESASSRPTRSVCVVLQYWYWIGLQAAWQPFNEKSDWSGSSGSVLEATSGTSLQAWPPSDLYYWPTNNTNTHRHTHRPTLSQIWEC